MALLELGLGFAVSPVASAVEEDELVEVEAVDEYLSILIALSVDAFSNAS